MDYTTHFFICQAFFKKYSVIFFVIFPILFRVMNLSGRTTDYKNTYLSGNLQTDIALFKEIFKKDCILRVKNIIAREGESFDCAVIYFDGMVDSEQVNDAVIEPLLTVTTKNESGSLTEYIEKQVLFARDVKKSKTVAQILEGILYGEVAILIQGSTTALNVDAKGFRTRGITEPVDERVLQGPREGFEEAALLNLAMLRRKLQTPDLCNEVMRVGRRSNTLVFICYLDSLADKKTLEEVKKRIKKIDIVGILDSNYLTEFIRDSRYSPFKTTGTTERPDTVAARLLEGRIAVIVDGTPMVLTVPYLFSENFQSDEDYYLNFSVATVGRMLRYICFFLSISIPAIFISLLNFHTELLPTTLRIAISELRGGVPFSPFSECIILIFIFEILREAGVRMQQSLGHTLSIVGGLVVGQAAVDAGIISTPMLIVIALSGISGLMIPRLRGAVFYLKVALVLVSWFLGLYGFILGITFMIMHIISLTSFGVDYTVTLRRADFQSLKDTLWRAPWNKMRLRPDFNKNIIRNKGINK